VPFILLEASDGVGGRVRTDEVDGFLLDRGFQIFLTSYPEAQVTARLVVAEYDAEFETADSPAYPQLPYLSIRFHVSLVVCRGGASHSVVNSVMLGCR
jgi:Flavin containing amine oxidoreductase